MKNTQARVLIHMSVYTGQRSEAASTSEVVEFDVGLSSVGEKISTVRVQVNGFGVKLNGEFEVVIYKSFLCFFRELGCQC